MIVFNAFYACFGVQQYSEAVQWLLRLDGDLRDSFRQDLLSLTRLMNILAHYEKSDFDLVPYLIQNTDRYFSNHHPERKFERLMLRGLKRIINQVPGSAEERTAFEHLLTEVRALFADDFERNVQRYFDFEAWLMAHIEGRSFAIIVQDKQRIVG